MRVDDYVHSEDKQTLGELIAELSKIDPETPVRLMCDHASDLVSVGTEKGVSHSIHLEVDFEYVTKLNNN